MENNQNISKYTFTAAYSNGSVNSASFDNEAWFLRAMCECYASGNKVIHAAVVDFDRDGNPFNVTTLDKYITEI